MKPNVESDEDGHSGVPADPAARERLLASISPEHAHEHHPLLRAVLAAEVTSRADPAGVHDYFENLYWCAFLLFCVGDPADVPSLWRAKQIDFDTSIGLDVEALLGAGVGPTSAWLRAHGHDDLADELAEAAGSEIDLAEWRADRERYFYS